MTANGGRLPADDAAPPKLGMASKLNEAVELLVELQSGPILSFPTHAFLRGGGGGGGARTPSLACFARSKTKNKNKN